MRFIKPKKLKKFFTKNEDKIVLVIGIILIALISFGAGRLTVIRQSREPIKIEDYGVASVKESIETQTTNKVEKSIKKPEEKEKMFIGSIKSRPLKYHLPDCQWAKRIKPENIIWFKSIEDAEAKGYVPANCCVGHK